MRLLAIGLAATIVVAVASSARAADDTTAATIEALRKQLDALQQQGAQNQQLIVELKKRVADLEAAKGAAAKPEAGAAGEIRGAAKLAEPPVLVPKQSAESALDAAVQELNAPAAGAAKTPAADLFGAKAGKAEIQLIDLSMDILVAGGGSSASPGEISNLQGGDHDPSRNGFSLQQAEISASGAVDPYFYGESHIVFKEDGVELEEAYGITLGMPGGLQAKTGYYLTEFGRVNPTHPHSWSFIDQPVVITRMFGGDGQRGAGLRLAWLMPVPWFAELQFGMQNATGAQMPSFFGDQAGATAHYKDAAALAKAGYTIGIAGRPITDKGIDKWSQFVYEARWAHSVSADATTVLIGASGERGPNQTGFDGYTWIYGGDFLVRWRPPVNEYGWPYISWQSEVIGRDYHVGTFKATVPAADFVPAHKAAVAVNLPERSFGDLGGYTMLEYGFVRDWALTLRGEYATGLDANKEERYERETDPLRDNRLRLAPCILFNPTHFSRLRLEYDYDAADFLKSGRQNANSLWLSLELLYGAHPAHNF
jgi:hypothetical protein